jgi:NAD+ synthase (glutamine-hydrolysing)
VQRDFFHSDRRAGKKSSAFKNSRRAVIGISGGLDSTLALLVTASTLICSICPGKIFWRFTMPGLETSDETYNNAVELMECMKVDIREISIKEACLQHFQRYWA